MLPRQSHRAHCVLCASESSAFGINIMAQTAGGISVEKWDLAQCVSSIIPE